MSSQRPRRPRADQPNSVHWENHKETLRRLYLEDNHPLKSVREIMQQKHEFNATDKMYKYHFKRWKFRKNMTQKEALKHEADAVAGRGVVLPYNNGRELGSQRLKMRIMKLNSPARTPDPISPSEIALRMIVNHSQDHMGSWDLPNQQSDTTSTESWASTACLAGYAISIDQETEANWRVLSKAAQDFSTILQKQEPMLVWSTCTIIIQLFQMDTELALKFINVVLYFCRNQLRRGDPLRTLWEAILNTNPSEIPELIVQLTKAQLDFLRNETETTNAFVVKYTKASAKYLHDRQLISQSVAHKQIDSIIWALKVKLESGFGTSVSAMNSFISASLFQACIHLDDREYDKVEEILEAIQPEVVAGFGIDYAQMVNFYEVKAEMLMERSDSERDDNHYSEHYYQKALEIAQDNLSETMPERIGFCFIALVNFYRRIGDADRCEEIQVRYNKHLKGMAGEHRKGMVGEEFEHLPFEDLSISKRK